MNKLVRFFHKNIWSLLPYGFRRTLLFKASTVLAPRPVENVEARWPIIVVGCFTTASGLGQSARLSYEAFKQAGLPVFGIDVGARLLQKSDMHYTISDGRVIEGPATLIFHVNAPLMPLVMAGFSRSFIRNKRLVGYWAWELPETPKDWNYGPPLVHEVWVTSQFTADAIRPIMGNKPVRVVHHPVALSIPQTDLCQSSTETGCLKVLTVFNATSSIARKNPIAAITAFMQAFGDNPSARMTIKAMNMETCPDTAHLIRSMVAKSANMQLIDTIMDQNALAQLYEAHDVLLSLHRSEGFGLPMVEAMLAGKAVVATHWSGNTDFMTISNSFPVPYNLVPACDPQQTYHHPTLQWADPDIAVAADHLRRLADDPVLRRQVGNQAKIDARNAFGLETYIRETTRSFHPHPPDAGSAS